MPKLSNLRIVDWEEKKRKSIIKKVHREEKDLKALLFDPWIDTALSFLQLNLVSRGKLLDSKYVEDLHKKITELKSDS